MTLASSANLEMAIVLPLGVVANQLMRIEADLRLLNMKALDFAKERDSGGLGELIEARLEHINEALDSIRSLVSDIQTDIRPRSTNLPLEDTRKSPEAVQSEYSGSKSRPERDD